MKSGALNEISQRLEARRKTLNEEFAKEIRAYFIALFKEAHRVEPKLQGMDTAMGVASASGYYTATFENETENKRACNWSPKQLAKGLPEVETFLAEVHDYSSRLLISRKSLPFIDDITVADL